MGKDKYNAPQGSDSEFVDEILAEARKMRGNATEELDDQDIPLAQARPVGNMYTVSYTHLDLDIKSCLGITYSSTANVYTISQVFAI